MENSLILTFAEIEFLLRACPDRSGTIRRYLRMKTNGDDLTVAAGVASLLARGLCRMSDGGEVKPTERITGVAAALSGNGNNANHHAEAVVWQSDRPVVMHLFDAGSLRLAVFPAAYGQYTVELLDAAEPLCGPVLRFVDSLSGGTGESAIAVRCDSTDPEVSLVAARDAEGGWRLSDSARNPDRADPATYDEVKLRIEQLFGAQPAGVPA